MRMFKERGPKPQPPPAAISRRLRSCSATATAICSKIRPAQIPQRAVRLARQRSRQFGRMPETQPLDFRSNTRACGWMARSSMPTAHQRQADHQCYESLLPEHQPRQHFRSARRRPTTSGTSSIRSPGACRSSGRDVSATWAIPTTSANWGACGPLFRQARLAAQAFLTSPSRPHANSLTARRFVRGRANRFARCVCGGIKKNEGGFVTVLWTIRGTRQLTLEAGGVPSHPHRHDGQRDGRPIRGTARRSSPSPRTRFSRRIGPIATLYARRGNDGRPPERQIHRHSKLDKLADWQVETEHSTELEWYNFECPRRKGDFAFETSRNLKT